MGKREEPNVVTKNIISFTKKKIKREHKEGSKLVWEKVVHSYFRHMSLIKSVSLEDGLLLFCQPA